LAPTTTTVASSGYLNKARPEIHSVVTYHIAVCHRWHSVGPSNHVSYSIISDTATATTANMVQFHIIIIITTTSSSHATTTFRMAIVIVFSSTDRRQTYGSVSGTENCKIDHYRRRSTGAYRIVSYACGHG
jgi:hypothetical protein